MLNTNAIKIVVMLVVGGVLGGCQGDTRATQVYLEKYEALESPAPHGSYVNHGRWVNLGFFSSWEKVSYTFNNGVLQRELITGKGDATTEITTVNYIKKGAVYYFDNYTLLFGPYRIFTPWEHGLILHKGSERVYLVSSSDNYTLPAAENLTGLPTDDELFDKLLGILLFVILFSVASSILFWWMKRSG